MVQNRAKIFAKGLVGVVAGACGYITCDIYNQRRSSSHTWKSLLNHYISIKALKVFGHFSSRSLEKYTVDCAQTQTQMLLERIQKNKDTDYGKDHNFSQIQSREDFVRLHPLTRYDHYVDYVNMVADGKKNVMTSSDVYMLGVTSGTSGQSKLLPTCKDLFTKFFLDGVCVVYSKMLNAFPNTNSLQRSMKLFYKPKWRESEGGVPIGPNSSTPDSSKQSLHLYSTPQEAYGIATEPEALYIHLLFALADRNLI